MSSSCRRDPQIEWFASTVDWTVAYWNSWRYSSMTINLLLLSTIIFMFVVFVRLHCEFKVIRTIRTLLYVIFHTCMYNVVAAVVVYQLISTGINWKWRFLATSNKKTIIESFDYKRNHSIPTTNTQNHISQQNRTYIDWPLPIYNHCYILRIPSIGLLIFDKTKAIKAIHQFVK